MTATMRAARAYQKELRFHLEDVVVPEVGPGEVLIEVQASGITWGLLSLWQWTDMIKLLPATLGSAIAGVVASVGDGVTSPEEGDRVFVDPTLVCGHCRYCVTGQAAYCDNLAVIGHAVYGEGGMPAYERYHNGGLAQYVRVPAANVEPLPEAVSFDVGARAGDVAVAVGALKKAAPGLGSTVVVNAATGAAGAATIACARALGVTRVIAVSRTRAGLEKVAGLAPDLVDMIAIEDLPEGWEQPGEGWQSPAALTVRILDLTGGRGADAVIDYVPVGSHATVQAVYAMRRGGRAVLVGGNFAELSLQYGRFMQNGWELSGLRGRTRGDQLEVVRLAEAGVLDLEPLVTHRIPLDRANEAIETVARRKDTPFYVNVAPSN